MIIASEWVLSFILLLQIGVSGFDGVRLLPLAILLDYVFAQTNSSHKIKDVSRLYLTAIYRA